MGTLTIHVHFHDGRYHGRGDWPPSPARLFQALVAGAGLSGPLGAAERQALGWLEAQPAPVIAAPRAWQARRGVLSYMPNNDGDRIEGDPTKMAKIRTATKVSRPYFFDAAVPILYAWRVGPALDDEENAKAICALSERLYQVGRGVDMAWAWGELHDENSIEGLLAAHQGQVFRPSGRGGGTVLPCLCRGSLESVERRYKAAGERFVYNREGKSVRVDFRQPPRARFQPVSYDSPPRRQLYDLRDATGNGVLRPWPLEGASQLVVKLRDAAVERLRHVMPSQATEICRVLVGRKPDGTNDCPPESRARIIPLPSIGHVHADRAIRRVLLEVPPTCLVSPDDLQWAFSGLDVTGVDPGEIVATLTRTDDDSFLHHYGVTDNATHRVWRTVTPAVLPNSTWRRGSGPRNSRAKVGAERREEEVYAGAAICQALRHAGVYGEIEAVHVQREPFEGKGRRAEEFAAGTRFEERRLWHVEVRFREPVSGPLALGDGRFLGFGVSAPVLTPTGVHLFAIESGILGSPDSEELAKALRRAVMARVQRCIDGPLPSFFSGHEPDGTPVRSLWSAHLAFTFDRSRSMLLVMAPHALEGREPSREEAANLGVLERALSGLRELRAGHAGLLSLRSVFMDVETDPLFAPARVWRSLTPYRVTRHVRADDARKALETNILTELRTRGLPRARVTVHACEGVSGRGLEGIARLEFEAAVRGPLLLGRSRYLGGGLFTSQIGEETRH